MAGSASLSWAPLWSGFRRHSATWKTSVLGPKLVVTGDEKAVRRLLQAEHRLVASSWPQTMRELLGPHSLLFAPAKRHKNQRRLLSQAFTEAAVERYISPISKTVAGALTAWAAESTRLSIVISWSAFTEAAMEGYIPAIAETVAGTLAAWATEGRVLAYPAARSLAFDVAATVLVGTRFGIDTIRCARKGMSTFVGRVMCWYSTTWTLL
ncbi:hypothetical protein WJX81_000081 [Elliptochloris bilobata]|uniref:Cytochrome P450 n=1 Tax=Elliptochloris bilobata TaxID=381761 RepID=A0AAW1RXX2_9CHLO